MKHKIIPHLQNISKIWQDRHGNIDKMDTPDTYIHDCSLLGLVLTLQSKDKGGFIKYQNRNTEYDYFHKNIYVNKR